MRRHDWSGFAALGAGVAALLALATGRTTWALAWLAVALVTGILTRYWSLRHPGPMPHLLRWTLAVPRGSHAPAHLARILEPRPGERLLEIGPGIGIHSLPMAQALAPGGTLDVFDIQQAMLDDLMGRAHAAGIANITPTRGNARTLPYPDGTFDGAYLIGVLGEIPDGQQALRELHRVLKPGGRLVVGEVLFDPDFVRLRALMRRAADAAFAFERRSGQAWSYLARFRAV